MCKRVFREVVRLTSFSSRGFFAGLLRRGLRRFATRRRLCLRARDGDVADCAAVGAAPVMTAFVDLAEAREQREP